MEINEKDLQEIRKQAQGMKTQFTEKGKYKWLLTL